MTLPKKPSLRFLGLPEQNCHKQFSFLSFFFSFSPYLCVCFPSSLQECKSDANIYFTLKTTTLSIGLTPASGSTGDLCLNTQACLCVISADPVWRRAVRCNEKVLSHTRSMMLTEYHTFYFYSSLIQMKIYILQERPGQDSDMIGKDGEIVTAINSSHSKHFQTFSSTLTLKSFHKCSYLELGLVFLRL